jgi:RND family efflux transporter MFP subunit
MNKKTTFFQKHKKTLIVVTILTVLVFGGRFILAKDSQVPRGKKEVIGTVKRENLKKEIKLSGTIQAQEDVTLRFQTSGLLNWVGVKEGDSVKKWQALASLDTRSLKKSLEKEMNDYLSERWDFEQTQDDYEQTREKHLVTDEIQRILDKAQFDLNNIVIDYELADLAIRLSTLTTPISGIVISIDQPFSGVNITPATAEFRVVNPQTLYFSAEVDEEEIALLKEDLPATITIDSYPDEKLSSQITYISLDPLSTGTTISYQVKFNLPPDRNSKYRLNMSGDAHVILEELKDALVIPIKYLDQEEDQFFVFIKKEDQVEKQKVETGLETDTKVQILEGLNESEKIVYYE